MSRTVTVYDISQVIGIEATQALVDAFPGASVYISTDPAALEFPSKDDRNDFIVNLFYSGKTYNEIADLTGMSKRNISRIIADNCNKK